MKEEYYYTIDGNLQSIDDFIQYVQFLKKEYYDFDFESWFCKEDFTGNTTYEELILYFKN